MRVIRLVRATAGKVDAVTRLKVAKPVQSIGRWGRNFGLANRDSSINTITINNIREHPLAFVKDGSMKG